jgi:osmoprotectant transport system permease protein
MSAVTDARTDAVGGAQGWRGLIAQPVAIAAVLAAYLVWLAVAPLTAEARTTLAPGALGKATLEHLGLTFSAAVIVLVIAVPLGVLLTRGRFRRYSAPVLAVANFGQAAPAIGLVVLLSMVMTGSGFAASLVALVLYAALPVLRNTMIGIRGVDERLVEAGRGMGMSRASVLFRIELPLVGTAALAAFVNGGGLGVLITTGVSLYLYPVLVSGALLISLLALAIDWLGRVVEHVARPKGL